MRLCIMPMCSEQVLELVENLNLFDKLGYISFMNLEIVILNGPDKEKRFSVKSGSLIGRSSSCHIKIQDELASGKHAQIKQNAWNQWVIEDFGSRNGLKVKGKKVDSLLLTNGAEFVIGTTHFRAEGQEADETVIPPDTHQTAPPTINFELTTPNAEQETIKIEPSSVEAKTPEWNELLESITMDWERRVKSKKQKLAPMIPLLVLEFTRGLQTDTVWTLGYGPRTAGATSLDLPIHEPEAPDICFQVSPSKKGIQFTTVHPQKVLLNERALTSEILKSGDVISIDQTEIKVKFEK